MSDIRLDAARRELWLRRGKTWSRREDLTVTELQLLDSLLRAEGAVLSRDVLLEAVWGDAEAVDPGAVDKHVAALRRKLGPPWGARLKSIYGRGYRWE